MALYKENKPKIVADNTIPADVTPLEDRRVRVSFKKPVFSPAPGQAVVFYKGDVVLGGAWIDEVE